MMKWLLIIPLAVLLVACGSSGSNRGPAEMVPPSVATQTAAEQQARDNAAPGESVPTATLQPTPVSDGSVPAVETLLTWNTYGQMTRVIDRRAGVVCYLMRDFSGSSDGGVGVAISCIGFADIDRSDIDR
jgi:hypothetical protein